MGNKSTAVLIMVMISFVAGNASATMEGGKGMMGGMGMAGGEKGMMMGEDRAGHFMMMVDMLQLNADQQKAVEAIHFAHRKEIVRKTADIDVAKIELLEIMDKELVKVEEAEKKIRAIAALHADLDVMHLKARETVKTKLTPEQLEKMKNHMGSEMRERMGDRRGLGMGAMNMGGMDMDCMGCMHKGGMDKGGHKMSDRSKKHEMMKDNSDRAKASGAGPAGKDEEKAPEHSRHH